MKQISNFKLANMIDKAIIQFENWKTEINTKPNPKMVHQLNNIVTIIDSVVDISKINMNYSYKALSHNIAKLTKQNASLTLTIMESLKEDDFIDDKEQNSINDALKSVIESAVSLIQLVQESFGKQDGKINQKIFE